jgi:hypothetical protein
VVRNGRTNSITADFMVFDPKGIRFVECKPRSSLEVLAASKPDEWVNHDGRWTRPPLDAWARERGVSYTIWSPPEPHGVYQVNLLALYGVMGANHCKEVDAPCVRRLCRALQSAPLTISAALALIRGLSGLHVLAALAKGYLFGPLQSVPIDEADRFTLFAVKSQASECDGQLLSQLQAHVSQPDVKSRLLLASPTDYSGAQHRLARVNQILVNYPQPGAARASSR